MQLFDHDGRGEALISSRVFNKKKSSYYKIKEFKIDLKKIYANLEKYGYLNHKISYQTFTEKYDYLKSLIKLDDSYKNLLNGPFLPFAFINKNSDQDIGKTLEKVYLPSLKDAFENEFPQSHFKAILQGDSKLESSVILDQNSNYQEFVNVSEEGLIGIYFPQALQEFDIDSQRSFMSNLPKNNNFNICLSGGIDICAALIGYPGLLINEKNYSPILCMSSYKHIDDRLVLLLKSYGPHLEFWCMSQMLTPSTKQVSEQWAGGITIFIGIR